MSRRHALVAVILGLIAVAMGAAVQRPAGGALAGVAVAGIAYAGLGILDSVRSIDRMVTRVERRIEALEAGQRRIVRRGKEQSKATRDRIRAAERFLTQIDDRNARTTFAQIEALLALYRDIPMAGGLPPTRGFAASPDLLRWLHRLVVTTKPQLVVECGSGISTLVIAHALETVGAGSIVAVEHESRHAEATRRLLDEYAVATHAEVRTSPLAPIGLEGESWPWYDLGSFPDGPIDLLLVDGPPGATRPHARYPAVPLLFSRLADQGLVVLDDMIRADEQDIATRWLEGFPTLDRVDLPHEKVTAVFRMSPVTRLPT